MRDLLKHLHDEMCTRLLEGSHDRWGDQVHELAEALWMESIESGITPHLCPDRYCDCHVALWEATPPTLFELE